jgi:hypothetical protein
MAWNAPSIGGELASPPSKSDGKRISLHDEIARSSAYSGTSRSQEQGAVASANGSLFPE